ncbi:MAG: hypothetical protein J0I20_03630 [Chloroflexi bacterium]|nr:hypothetical protein [Chloroflexota bacterium]OJV89165.1 MAG: hypothetical protein BGO39_34715 [Chloroflexi bacterium 54-19]
MKKNNNIAQVQINWSGSQSEVGWEWIGGFQAEGDYHDGGGRALFEGGDAMPIFLIGPNLEKPIFFGDIIKVYGEPSHILAGFNRNVHGGTTYFYYLAYLPLGFALYHSETHKFDISSKKFYFDSILFFANNSDGFNKVFAGENDYKYFVPWRGFKSFDFYCQTREKNDFEPCSNI